MKTEISEHIIEFVCDAGEGAQKAGTSFAQASARMGNSLWTVEIIPAEIQPPPHTVGSTSGLRIRLARKPVRNGGDLANLVVAFNEMNLYSRILAGSIASDAIILIDSIWADSEVEQFRKQYRDILNDLRAKGARIYEVPIEAETRRVMDDPRLGKNMFALGLLCYLYSRDMDVMRDMIAATFRKKSEAVLNQNLSLLNNGYEFAADFFDFQFVLESPAPTTEMVAMNGNTALALGSIAAGFEVCSMYPITPATSVSHYLAEIFEEHGGLVHQAEDEIAAIGVAVGCAYAGRPAITVTSGPGMALKTEFMGLTVMTETPLVLIDVQRGGPSTGLPTKIEQADLLAALYSTPGDAPKVIIAPGTIEECFHVMRTARKIAEEFRMLVIVLSDANLATGVQLFPRPKITRPDPAPCDDLSPVETTGEKGEALPFDWDESTGLSRRLIPGAPRGMSMTPTLNHGRNGLVRYDSVSNQYGHRMRSRKLAVLQKTLRTPEPYGDVEGDLLVVGWGSTRGAIEEAVDRARDEGHSVSALNIRFLSPLPPGLKAVFQKYKRIMTVELNYSDAFDDPDVTGESRRYSQLATVLRAHTLIDIDCYSIVPGRPFMPAEIHREIVRRMSVHRVAS
ncbi:MAG: 2-oxoacid:acceptor oxidoreductase subunit alpha [Leptospiraceae bacterium]|nr:2-oxoacid:acceptor oxidoreductase subunit alpha [Leptospiraceae bacterium]